MVNNSLSPFLSQMANVTIRPPVVLSELVRDRVDSHQAIVNETSQRNGITLTYGSSCPFLSNFSTFQMEFYLQSLRSHASLVQHAHPNPSSQHLRLRRAGNK